MPSFALKWTSDDPSSSLILTYHARWHEQINRGAFSVEFRLSGPRNMSPSIVYTYLATRIRAITARISVKRSGYVSVTEAVSLWRQTLLTADDLRKYAGTRKSLFLYEFGSIEMTDHPITYNLLSSEYGYFPSSNFFPLSQEGQERSIAWVGLGCPARSQREIGKARRLRLVERRL